MNSLKYGYHQHAITRVFNQKKTAFNQKNQRRLRNRGFTNSKAMYDYKIKKRIAGITSMQSIKYNI